MNCIASGTRARGPQAFMHPICTTEDIYRENGDGGFCPPPSRWERKRDRRGTHISAVHDTALYTRFWWLGFSVYMKLDANDLERRNRCGTRVAKEVVSQSGQSCARLSPVRAVGTRDRPWKEGRKGFNPRRSPCKEIAASETLSDARESGP